MSSLLSLFLLLVMVVCSYGQTNPNFMPGQILPAAQLNSAFQLKMDYPCIPATVSVFGCVKPDGTTITSSGGIISAVGGGGSSGNNSIVATPAALIMAAIPVVVNYMYVVSMSTGGAQNCGLLFSRGTTSPTGIYGERLNTGTMPNTYWEPLYSTGPVKACEFGTVSDGFNDYNSGVNSGTDNELMIQAALDYAMNGPSRTVPSATLGLDSVVCLSDGGYATNDSLQVGWGESFHHIELRSCSDGHGTYNGNYPPGVGLFPKKTDRCAINIQGGRNVVISGISMMGPNMAYHDTVASNASFVNQASVTSGAAGTGATVTLTYPAGYVYPVGQQILVQDVQPAGYNGIYTVTGGNGSTTVTYAGSQTGAQTVAGSIERIGYGNAITTAATQVGGAGGTATLTFTPSLLPGNAGHLFPTGAKIRVSNVTPTGFNGVFTITASTATTVSYVNPTNVSGPQTVAGAIQQIGLPSVPAAWLKPSLGGQTGDQSGGIQRTAPFGGICLDPYAGTPSGGIYPVRTYPTWVDPSHTLPQYSLNPSSDTTIERGAIIGFPVGIINQPATASQGDFLKIRDMLIGESVYGIANTGTQSRNVEIRNVNFNGFYTAITNVDFGNSAGNYGGPITNLSGSNGYQVFRIAVGAASIFSSSFSHFEDQQLIGTFFSGNSSSVVIEDSQFDFRNGNDGLSNPTLINVVNGGNFIFKNNNLSGNIRIADLAASPGGGIVNITWNGGEISNNEGNILSVADAGGGYQSLYNWTSGIFMGALSSPNWPDASGTLGHLMWSGSTLGGNMSTPLATPAFTAQMTDTPYLLTRTGLLQTTRYINDIFSGRRWELTLPLPRAVNFASSDVNNIALSCDILTFGYLTTTQSAFLQDMTVGTMLYKNDGTMWVITAVGGTAGSYTLMTARQVNNVVINKKSAVCVANNLTVADVTTSLMIIPTNISLPKYILYGHCDSTSFTVTSVSLGDFTATPNGSMIGKTASNDALFTATLDNGAGGAGTVLNVTSMMSGTIGVGGPLGGAGITDGTYIVAQVSGTPGQVGIYTVSPSQGPFTETMGSGPSLAMYAGERFYSYPGGDSYFNGNFFLPGTKIATQTAGTTTTAGSLTLSIKPNATGRCPIYPLPIQ